MACFHPLELYRTKSGKLLGTKPAGEVPRPVTVPCGQCRGCRLERSRQWAVRCVHEAKTHDHNSFITLTYNAKNLPADGSLDLGHWQLFAKRLRKKSGPFRFYHCGEYGDLNNRPHYHAIIFGLDFSSDRVLDRHTPQGHKLWTSKLLTDTWGKGNAHIGSVTLESASYVARYCMKRKHGDEAKAHYQGRKPEYATMSRRPGIGAKWFEQFGTDVFPHDYVVSQDGRETRPPKYYDTLLEKRHPKQLEAIKAKRVRDAQKHSANNTPARLAVRETVLNAKLTTLKRAL